MRAGWYRDPRDNSRFRWFDGVKWTDDVADTPPTDAARSRIRFFRPFPRTAADWKTFAVAAAIGLVLWLLFVASLPRYDYDNTRNDQISGWFMVLMLAAALLMGFVCLRTWNVVALGLVAPQFVSAAFTTPRGDDDGLWVLIYFVLVFLALFLYALAVIGHLVSVVTRPGPRDRRDEDRGR